MTISHESFDEYRSSENLGEYQEIMPFPFRKDETLLGSAKGGSDVQMEPLTTLEWLNMAFENRLRLAESRLYVYRRYHALYKGIHWRSQDTRDSNRDIEESIRKPKMVYNFIQEMVQAKMSQRGKNKVAIAVVPQTSEQTDLNNARAAKLLLDNRAEKIDLDNIITRGDQVLLTFGHQFSFVMWNKHMGELRKMVEGQEDKRTRVGDVDVFVYGPDRVFPEPNKNKWEEVNDLFFYRWMHVSEARARWRKHKDDIHETADSLYFDYDTLKFTKYDNHCLVRHYFYRKNELLPEGAYIISTNDVILYEGPHPYDDGELPCVPDTDIDVHEELWGRSFISNIEQLQRHFNNITSGIARNHGIGSAPKWMMPKGACSVSSLNNEFVIVEYSGPVAPQLVAMNPTGREIFEYQEKLESYIKKLSAIYDISQGNPPPGVTANSALRFLDEQESQRDSRGIAKRNMRVKKIYKMMLQRMAQFYSPDEERIVHILGRDNNFLIRKMSSVDFKATYDVRIMNQSALPDTKTGKISAIIDLNQATADDPVFKRAEIVEALDLGLDDAFKDAATIASTAAKSALESLLEGDEVAEPQIFDNLFITYDVFLRELQSRGFKEKTDSNIQNDIISYLTVVEGLMSIRAEKNMLFAQKLQSYDTYPLFFTVAMEGSPMERAGVDQAGAEKEEGMGGQGVQPGTMPTPPDIQHDNEQVKKFGPGAGQ
ncbi:MAG: hypothetical protein DRQ88_09360 [Epsilonproteobacteria bacterium]|nr:MAG: hypothetical protein DRQ88_09360 [Campylobacterota bacterium]